MVQRIMKIVAGALCLVAPVFVLAQNPAKDAGGP